MDEKRRFNHLLGVWRRSGVKDLEDEQLDFLNSEIRRFKGWDRRSRLQYSRLNNLLRKFNDRLEEVLKEKGLV